MRTITMAGALLLAAGPVFAQTQTPPSPAAGAAAAPPAHAAPAARARPAPISLEAQVNQRITELHARMKITPEQQPAWDAFAQTMRDNALATDQAYKARRASVGTMSAPDNMKNFAQIEQDRAAGMQKLAASFETLYDGMSDQQKQLADNTFRHFADRPGAPRKAAAK